MARTCGWDVNGERCGKPTRGPSASYCREHHKEYMRGWNRKPKREPVKKNDRMSLIRQRRIKELTYKIVPKDVAVRLIFVSNSGGFRKWDWKDKLKLLTALKQLVDGNINNCVEILKGIKAEMAPEAKEIVEDSIERLGEL